LLFLNLLQYAFDCQDIGQLLQKKLTEFQRQVEGLDTLVRSLQKPTWFEGARREGELQVRPQSDENQGQVGEEKRTGGLISQYRV